MRLFTRLSLESSIMSDMKPAIASSSLACVVLTTMGRVLLQCECDTALPFHFERLALLLASCLQYATNHQEYARLDLQNGFSVVMSVDPSVSIACAVIVNEEEATELARLQSLIILKEFVRVFRERVEKIVEANRVAAAEMAEAYTLTSALGGAGSGMDEYKDDDGTLEEFLPFHHRFAMRILEMQGDRRDRAQPPVSNPDGVDVRQARLINGETGAWVVTAAGAQYASCLSEDFSSQTVSELARRSSRAFARAFPLLSRDGGGARVSGANPTSCSGRLSPITMVLFIKTRSTHLSHYVAIRMLELGVFASVVHYCVSSRDTGIHGKRCELVPDGDLARGLASDPRGAALLRFLHDARTSSTFDLDFHIGSDGVPEAVNGCLEDILGPWRVQFERTSTE